MKDNVALVTESFWRKRLGSDPGVIGRSIALNDVAHTIVGVLPNLPISWFGRDSEVFIATPFDNPNATKERIMRGYSFMRCIGRLKPGVTVQQAQAAMPALEQSYREQHGEAADSTWTSASSLARTKMQPVACVCFRDIPSAAIGRLLLRANRDVANLLLRSLHRTNPRRNPRCAWRSVASARGIVRLFVFEGHTVSVIAGIIGLLLALWVSKSFRN